MSRFDYSRLRATGDRLLTRFAQGNIVLSRTTTAPGANRWEDPVEATQTETLRGVVEGVAAAFVDGSTVLATDLQVTCAPPSMGIQPGDTLTIDGKSVTIISPRAEPAAGPPAAYVLIVR
ncbi:MAG: hypothetical protein FJX25_05820 [Alphaproteobacteria bacterium]|nr:hypothetical protein [Alphaproteobacteria bacterium]